MLKYNFIQLMIDMVWKPHVTVAALIKKDSCFLFVEEKISNKFVFNQPAGHLEEGEDILSAVKREVNEETAWQFEPKYIVSIHLWRKNPTAPSFLRVNFAGDAHSFDKNQPLDKDIYATHWLTHEEILAKKASLRSPLVLEAVSDYLRGESHPLSLLKSFLNNDI